MDESPIPKTRVRSHVVAPLTDNPKYLQCFMVHLDADTREVRVFLVNFSQGSDSCPFLPQSWYSEKMMSPILQLTFQISRHFPKYGTMILGEGLTCFKPSQATKPKRGTS